ncbi:MAG: riboflavin biosynthesis protein RibF [Clostridia bacterium]|nr:riboflavin biosynthesis protein RibF [Clostridia bacterium]
MERTSVALGSFDGLHAGHQSVLQSALSDMSDGLLPVVLLFDAHPQKVLRGSAPPLLMAESQRDALLRQMGFSLRTVVFSEVCAMEPAQFVREILRETLHAATVSCGYNYRFGKGGQANANELRRLCAREGITTHICAPVEYGGVTVSSTRIRTLLENGEADKAAELLTRPFTFTETVRHGDENGRRLGFPTINQPLPPQLVTPKFGVYASRTMIDGVWRDSITNIGVRPTLPDDTPGCETHILGFDGVLYGQQIPVGLLRYVRPERRFRDLEEVFRQVRLDVETAFPDRG